MLNRRFLFRLSLVPGFLLLLGHAPWGQWQIYRQRHMLFLSTREDKPSYPFSKTLVSIIELYLPEASPRPARAKDYRTVHGLLSTDQMPVAVLSKNVARSLILGEKEFKDYAPVEMKLLYDFGDIVLITRPQMPENHAWRIVDAILRSNSFKLFDYKNTSPIEIHSGALKSLKGESIPEE